VVHGGKASPESPEWQGLIQQLMDDASPYGAAGLHYIHDVIEPHKTRDYISRALAICQDSRNGGIGEHKLANWPTKF
jgi:methylmalonyl-CoA decarboxylase subunit alpha